MLDAVTLFNHFVSPGFFFALAIVCAFAYAASTIEVIAEERRQRVLRTLADHAMLIAAVSTLSFLAILVLQHSALNQVALRLFDVAVLSGVVLVVAALWDISSLPTRQLRDRDIPEPTPRSRARFILWRTVVTLLFMTSGLFYLLDVYNEVLPRPVGASIAVLMAAVGCTCISFKLIHLLTERVKVAADRMAASIWVPVAAFVGLLVSVVVGLHVVQLPQVPASALTLASYFLCTIVLGGICAYVGCATIVINYSGHVTLQSFVPSFLTATGIPTEFVALEAYVSKSLPRATYACLTMAVFCSLLGCLALYNRFVVPWMLRRAMERPQCVTAGNLTAGLAILQVVLREPGIRRIRLSTLLMPNGWNQNQINSAIAAIQGRWIRIQAGRCYPTERGQFMQRIGMVPVDPVVPM